MLIFLKRHKMPQPHIAAGHICSSFPRVTLNDVSDGLASELNEIAEASCVMIEIEADKLPIHQIYRCCAKTGLNGCYLEEKTLF